MGNTSQTNAVATINGHWVPAVDNRADIDLIKKTYAQGLTDNELNLLIAHGNQMGLSIIKRQIYGIVRGKGDKRQMGIQVGIDGYRAITEANPDFAGYTAPEWCGTDGVWVEVWLKDAPPAAARIGIYRKGFSQPIWGMATYKEFVQLVYDQYTKKQIPNSMWQKMPANQLLKCAEAQAHRKATPGVLAGTDLYEEDAPEVETVEGIGGRTVTVSSADDPDAWNKANRQLRAIAAENKITDRHLHLFAMSKGATSLKDVSAANLNGLSGSLRTNPDGAMPFFADLEREYGKQLDVAIEQESAEPTTVVEGLEGEEYIEGEFTEVDESTGEISDADREELERVNAEVGAKFDAMQAQQGQLLTAPTAHAGHGNA